MGSLFMSEEMALCQIFFQTESAYACVSELGELGCVQFNDLNSEVNAFQRKFVNEVKRCDDMERALKYIEKELKGEGIVPLDADEETDSPLSKEMVDLEDTFRRLEKEIRDVNLNTISLKKTFLELTELKYILRNTKIIFDESDPDDSNSSQKSLVIADQRAAVPLSFIAGVIPRDKVIPFERMLWRVCRGNTFVRLLDIEQPLEDPVTRSLVPKMVFVIFYQGDQLKNKVKKICDGFRARVYPCPESSVDRRDMANGVMTRLEDLNIVLRQTWDHKERMLMAASRNIGNWMVKVQKMKAIFHIMNGFNIDITQKCLITECWCPVRDLYSIQLSLNRANKQSGSAMPPIINRMPTTHQIPPTYNRTNKFTSAFQNIVNAYGVCTYREVNPAPFTIITFPFLFAVMFGDFGHGLLMTLFASWMVIKEKKLMAEKSNNEIWNTCFGGRYIILLMGIFSIYTGLIYNDVFAKSFNIFGSSWSAPNLNVSGIPLLTLAPNTSFYGTPYPFGIDPIWQMSKNKIIFLNSFKMKTSITLGVTQMLFGIFLSIFNHLNFRKYMNIFCEFIPQMLFMLSIFGYLVVLIFHKWIFYHSSISNCAPPLLIQLINMFMFNYPKEPCNLILIYPVQKTIQTCLVVVAFLCVPWMLLIKPFILYLNSRYQQRHRRLVNSVSMDSTLESTGVNISSQTASDFNSQLADDHVEFGEIFIHQIIHTIEFCLGSISHTASYLRLWALSLAHGQLSEVLWTMIMTKAFLITELYGCVLVYFVFGAWACLTIGILLVMEGLSAFLHALRLHWVEFQSKFYSGTGHAFAPFSFKVILELAFQIEQ